MAYIPDNPFTTNTDNGLWGQNRNDFAPSPVSPRPRPYFDEFSQGIDTPARPAPVEDVEGPWYPRLKETFWDDGGRKIGRAVESLASLVSPVNLIGGVQSALGLDVPEHYQFTEEQRVMGALGRDATRAIFPRQEYLREVQTAIREGRTPPAIREEYPALVPTIEEYGSLSPLGEQGTRPLARYIEREGLSEFFFEALPFIPPGVSATRRMVTRTARFIDDPIGIGRAFDDVNLITGRTSAEQMARSSVVIDAVSETGEILHQGTGTFVSPTEILTASHVPFRDSATGNVLRPAEIRYRTLGGPEQFTQRSAQGVLGLDPQRDLMLLEAANPVIDYVDIDTALRAGQPHISLNRTESGHQIAMGGRTTGRYWQDPATLGRIGESTAPGGATFSGAGYYDPSSPETIIGMHLGVLDEQSIFTPGTDIAEFLTKTSGRPTTLLSRVDPARHVATMEQHGLSFRLARNDPGLLELNMLGGLGVSAGVGLGSLALQGGRIRSDNPLVEHVYANTLRSILEDRGMRNLGRLGDTEVETVFESFNALQRGLRAHGYDTLPMGVGELRRIGQREGFLPSPRSGMPGARDRLQDILLREADATYRSPHERPTAPWARADDYLLRGSPRRTRGVLTLEGGRAYERRFPVQYPLNVEFMDPRSVGEGAFGGLFGMTLYSDDVRRTILDLVTPELPLSYREELIGRVTELIDVERFPKEFRETSYAGVVGVPGSPDRVSHRGYNLADIIGRTVAEKLEVPFYDNLIVRNRATERSAAFVGNAGARRANLRGAFTVLDPSFVAGRRFLGVDDLITTGTTAEFVSEAFRAAGAQGVDFFGFAKSIPGMKIPPVLSQFQDAPSSISVSRNFGLTDLQRAASRHIEGRGEIRAIPGSGKTHVLRENLRFMTKRGIPSSDILSVTFSRSAADELRDRLSDIGNFPVRTLDSLAYEIVHTPEYADLLGFAGSSVPKLIPELTEQRFRAMTRDRGISGLDVDMRQSRALRSGRVAKTGEERGAAFEAYKQERGIATFGDYRNLALELLETYPDIRQTYRERYPYIRVDEAQDLPEWHWRFLDQIVDPDNPNLLVVGDPNQNLYDFIGSTGEGLETFAKTAQRYALSENFRSRGNIVNFTERYLEETQGGPLDRPFARGVRPGGEVTLTPTTGDTIFSALEKEISGRDPASYSILVRTNREIAALQKHFGEAIEGVNVGTVHAAKGKEWPTVFMPLETIPTTFGGGIYDVYRRQNLTARQLASEQRIAYVGASRAEDALHILGSGDRFDEFQRALTLEGGFSYGFAGRMDPDAASLSDLDRLIRGSGRYFRATHLLEDSFSNISLDWQQTLNLSHRLQELEPYDLPLRGEESALFPREFYQKYQRELDYMLHPKSFVAESPYERGMMGVYRPGIYVGQDLEMIFKHGFWNPNPRYHMGGSELRVFEGEKIMEGFVSGEPSFYAPAGETIITPTRQIGTFPYEDLYDLRTGETFTGTPMQVARELENYGLRDLQPLDRLEEQLRLRLEGGRAARVRAVDEYQGELSRDIWRYKEKLIGDDIRNVWERDRLTNQFAHFIHQNLPEDFNLQDYDYILPLPSSERSLSKREGFSPVGAIAERLSDISGIPLLTNVLEDVGGSTSKTLGQAARRARASEDQFRLLDASAIAGKSVLFFDDVKTTGTTLRSAIQTVGSAGPSQLDALTLANRPWLSRKEDVAAFMASEGIYKDWAEAFNDFPRVPGPSRSLRDLIGDITEPKPKFVDRLPGPLRAVVEFLTEPRIDPNQGAVRKGSRFKPQGGRAFDSSLSLQRGEQIPGLLDFIQRVDEHPRTFWRFAAGDESKGHHSQDFIQTVRYGEDPDVPLPDSYYAERAGLYGTVTGGIGAVYRKGIYGLTDSMFLTGESGVFPFDAFRTDTKSALGARRLAEELGAFRPSRGKELQVHFGTPTPYPGHLISPTESVFLSHGVLQRFQTPIRESKVYSVAPERGEFIDATGINFEALSRQIEALPRDTDPMSIWTPHLKGIQSADLQDLERLLAPQQYLRLEGGHKVEPRYASEHILQAPFFQQALEQGFITGATGRFNNRLYFSEGAHYREKTSFDLYGFLFDPNDLERNFDAVPSWMRYAEVLSAAERYNELDVIDRNLKRKFLYPDPNEGVFREGSIDPKTGREPYLERTRATMLSEQFGLEALLAYQRKYDVYTEPEFMVYGKVPLDRAIGVADASGVHWIDPATRGSDPNRWNLSPVEPSELGGREPGSFAPGYVQSLMIPDELRLEGGRGRAIDISEAKTIGELFTAVGQSPRHWFRAAHPAEDTLAQHSFDLAQSTEFRTLSRYRSHRDLSIEEQKSIFALGKESYFGEPYTTMYGTFGDTYDTAIYRRGVFAIGELHDNRHPYIRGISGRGREGGSELRILEGFDVGRDSYLLPSEEIIQPDRVLYRLDGLKIREFQREMGIGDSWLQTRIEDLRLEGGRRTRLTGVGLSERSQIDTPEIEVPVIEEVVVEKVEQSGEAPEKPTSDWIRIITQHVLEEIENRSRANYTDN